MRLKLTGLKQHHKLDLKTKMPIAVPQITFLGNNLSSDRY